LSYPEHTMFPNSMTEEIIQTLHPLGKTGRNISKEKYELIKQTMLAVLKEETLTHNELFEEIEKRLTNKFSGNISWYAETVKLDLEARNMIERTDHKPQKYKLK